MVSGIPSLGPVCRKSDVSHIDQSAICAPYPASAFYGDMPGVVPGGGSAQCDDAPGPGASIVMDEEEDNRRIQDIIHRFLRPRPK